MKQSYFRKGFWIVLGLWLILGSFVGNSQADDMCILGISPEGNCGDGGTSTRPSSQSHHEGSTGTSGPSSAQGSSEEDHWIQIQLRNATEWAIEYQIENGVYNGTSWVGIQPGKTRHLWIRDDQYLIYRWTGSQHSGHAITVNHVNAKKVWWMFTTQASYGPPILQNDTLVTSSGM